MPPDGQSPSHPPSDRRAATGGPRTVVLGGTGFLGRHVCDAFARAGHDVVVLCRRPADDMPSVRFRAVDLARVEPGPLARLLRAERATTVVNAAGAVWDVTEDELDRINVDLVRRLVAAVGDVPGPVRLVHLGSMHEYAPQLPGIRTDENTAAAPTTAYGRSKLRGTELVLAAAGRVDGVVLRVANVAGPGSPALSLLGRVARLLAAAARTGQPAALTLAPLRARRDFVDVRDVADAAVAAACRQVRGRPVNIGRGEAVGVRHLVDLLVAASGVPATVEELEPDASARRTGPDWLEVEIALARVALGWAPRRPLGTSVAALWDTVGPAAPGRAA